jgi:hypothetical protein
VTGGGVSGSDMPSLPWTARQDVSPVEDTSLAALLAGSGLPAGADAELRPVADVLAALAARPAGDELTGLAAARAEFRRHVAGPVHVRRSPRRLVGLASRLGVKAGAAAAVVVMGLGGAAAAAYADALPVSWQQFAHRAIGAPVHAVGHVTRPATGVAGSAAHPPKSRHPAYRTHSSGPPARSGFPRLTRPAHHAGPLTEWPFGPRGGLPAAPFAPRPPRPARRDGADRRPEARASNARSMRGVS